MRRLAAIVIAAAIAGGLAGGLIGLLLGGEASGASTSVETTVASPSSPDRYAAPVPAETIYQRDAPGVVVITDTRTRVIPATIFSPKLEQQVGALGSGFVIDRRGDVLTNEHVVHGSTRIRVGFSSGATYPATIVGQDASSDLAVVRVHAPAGALHPLALGDSQTVKVGEPVYAIGNPFGLDRTMTAGIVSATGRDIDAPNGLTIPDAIQTDAAINHGNSGGPLLDPAGNVVGINSQIESGTVNANVGVGFAVPSDTAKTVAAQLIAQGHADHAWLGVEIETIDPSVAATVRGLPRQGVTIVRVVKGSPAAKAGLEAATRQVTVNGISAETGGDSIVAVNGKPVISSAELSAEVALLRPGSKLELQVVRGGKQRTVAVMLGNVPS